MLLVGYLLGATSPVVLGFARDVLGDFSLVTWIPVGVAVAQLPLALALHPQRLEAADG